MNNKALTQSMTKRSLKAHSWMGLFISAFMYIICLSGTIAVFHHEFERWEQPQVDEATHVNTQKLNDAFHVFIKENTEKTEHFHIVFPTSGIPRVVIENDHIAQFMNIDGSLGEVENPFWTKMLVDLHVYLHLPKSFGVIVVSAFGGLLCAIILSGFLSHPRIIKDAFIFRRGGTGLQENIDLHNRLSVWASPFHIMIGITGTFFGLATVVIFLLSQAFYNGDNQAVIDEVFTPEPVLEQAIQTPNILPAIDYIENVNPNGKPIFLTVHEPNTPGQFIEVYVQQPNRLIYSENYRFDIQGNFIGLGGYKDGPIGKQIIYSLYRLHFGDFYGLPSKLLYFILGMMLTIVSATGINIWLNKRKTKDIITYAWPAIVWGTPIAFVFSALINLIISFRIDASIWLTLVILITVAAYQKDELKTSMQCKKLLGLSIVLLLIGYNIKYQAAAFTLAALQINIPMIIFAIFILHSTKKANVNNS